MTDATFSLLCGAIVGASSAQLLRILAAPRNLCRLFDLLLSRVSFTPALTTRKAFVSSLANSARSRRVPLAAFEQAYLQIFASLRFARHDHVFRFLCYTASSLRTSGLISPRTVTMVSMLNHQRLREHYIKGVPDVLLEGRTDGIIISLAYSLVQPDIFAPDLEEADGSRTWLNPNHRALEADLRETILSALRTCDPSAPAPLAGVPSDDV